MLARGKLARGKLLRCIIELDAEKSCWHLHCNPACSFAPCVCRVAARYARTWFLYDALTSCNWQQVLPRIMGDHWIVTTPEIKHALPLILLARVLALQYRTSFFSAELLQFKHATLSVLKFASFVVVRADAFADALHAFRCTERRGFARM